MFHLFDERTKIGDERIKNGDERKREEIRSFKFQVSGFQVSSFRFQVQVQVCRRRRTAFIFHVIARSPQLDWGSNSGFIG